MAHRHNSVSAHSVNGTGTKQTDGWTDGHGATCKRPLKGGPPINDRYVVILQNNQHTHT